VTFLGYLFILASNDFQKLGGVNLHPHPLDSPLLWFLVQIIPWNTSAYETTWTENFLTKNIYLKLIFIQVLLGHLKFMKTNQDIIILVSIFSTAKLSSIIVIKLQIWS